MMSPGLNAVEIEEAVSALAEAPFDADGFPFAFLQAFGNKETTPKRLREGESLSVCDASDVRTIISETARRASTHLRKPVPGPRS